MMLLWVYLFFFFLLFSFFLMIGLPPISTLSSSSAASDVYKRQHSDYVGGMKEQTLKEKLAKKPEDVIYLAVKGMLPKGPLGRQMIKKLHVYAGAEHNHAAQQPKALEIKY